MKAIALALLLTTGCATLFAGGPDEIPINTNPPGAYVYVNGNVVGQTPTVVTLDRGSPGQIQIYLPGFQPIVMMRDKGFNGWFWANIAWLPTFLWVVDLIDGNFQRFDDSPIAIGLTPNAAGPPPAWAPQQPQQPMQPMQPMQPPGAMQPPPGPPPAGPAAPQ